MLIEFRVENFRSLRDEQALTFEAGRLGDDSDQRLRRVAGHGEPLLPAAAIYGANASGKSNVLSALRFMRDAVIHSQRIWEPDTGVPRVPFGWGGKQHEISSFEVTFLIEGTKLQYGFCVNDESVEEEWLFAWPGPHHRKQVWFEREADDFQFGEHLKGPNTSAREVTRKNSLFLSAAPQQNHRQLTSLYHWFRRIIANDVQSRSRRLERRGPFSFKFMMPQGGAPIVVSDEVLETGLRRLLQIADIGVVDVKRVVDDVDKAGRSRILLQHQAGDANSWLKLEDESAGTRALFRIAPSLFRALESGGVLVIDELESSLHPLIGRAIVKLFNNPETNPHNAQILFTTHDTSLLGSTMEEPLLRRDQVWFTEKDAGGATKLYPLTDYKPRNTENLERGYLQGRYGAIPWLGDFSWITK